MGSAPAIAAASPTRSADAPLPADLEVRVPVLDGVRGLAIGLVFMHNLYGEKLSTNTVDFAVRCLFKTGWIGVDLFFVLSGFLISGILLDAVGNTHYFRDFYARRVLRIFPLYYVALCFLFFVLPHINLATPKEIADLHEIRWWYWGYAVNYAAGLYPNVQFYTVGFWSLAVEEQFYLIWPLVVLYCSRRTLARACVAILILGVLLRSVWLVSDFHAKLVLISLPTRLDGFAVGALLALAARAQGLRHWWPTIRRVGLWALPIAVVTAFTDEMGWRGNYLKATIGFLALALVFGALIAAALLAPTSSRTHRVFAHPVMRWLGKYSYAMYMFHGFVYAVLVRKVPIVNTFGDRLGSPALGAIAFLIIAASLTAVAAYASWHLFEKHFLRLKRFFPRARLRESSFPAAVEEVAPLA